MKGLRDLEGVVMVVGMEMEMKMPATTTTMMTIGRMSVEAIS